VTWFSCIAIHEMHVCHFCIYVNICHCHQNNTIYYTDQLTECIMVTGDCLYLHGARQYICIQISKWYARQAVVFKHSKIQKVHRSEMWPFQRHVHINFFHCFSVGKHILEFGNFFFVQLVYIRVDSLGSWSLRWELFILKVLHISCILPH
jgi:hypothetical protein